MYRRCLRIEETSGFAAGGFLIFGNHGDGYSLDACPGRHAKQLVLAITKFG